MEWPNDFEFWNCVDEIMDEEELDEYQDIKLVAKRTYDEEPPMVSEVYDECKKNVARQNVVTFWLSGMITSKALVDAIELMGDEKYLIKSIEAAEYEMMKKAAEEMLEAQRMFERGFEVAIPSDDWRDRYCAFSDLPCP